MTRFDPLTSQASSPRRATPTGQTGATRITSVCGSTDSVTATVTVCLTINTQPASQQITTGQTAMLMVAATGDGPISYQWYQGTSGNTTNPIPGATASSYTTPPLTVTSNQPVASSLSAMLRARRLTRPEPLAGDGENTTVTY